MSEVLCTDCPLRERHPDLDIPRINPEIQDDVAMVSQQTGAKALLAAIATERPERCESLRKVLAQQHVGVRSKPFAECPEIGLIQLLYK